MNRFIVHGERDLTSKTIRFTSLHAYKHGMFMPALSHYVRLLDTLPENQYVFLTKTIPNNKYYPESSPFSPFHFIIYQFPERDDDNRFYVSQPILQYTDLQPAHEYIVSKLNEQHQKWFVRTLFCTLP